MPVMDSILANIIRALERSTRQLGTRAGTSERRRSAELAEALFPSCRWR